VPGLLPLQLSAHRALTNQARGRLVTRTLHAELVYGLSGSKHVRWSVCVWGGVVCCKVQLQQQKRRVAMGDSRLHVLLVGRTSCI
jgi:hypothetical protein